jgi:hypothetical protein
MIQLRNKWQDLGIELGEIFNETTAVKNAADDDLDAIVVSVHVAALVVLGHERKPMRS